MALYGTIWLVQQEEIKHYCFDECGKVYFGVVDDKTTGPISTCGEDECPHLDKQMDEPIGEVDGDPLIIRKLKDLPEKENDDGN